MRQHAVWLMVVGAVGAMVASGCGSGRPVEQIEAARSSFDAAQAAEAELYAGSEYRRAEQAMAALRDELEAQDEAFPLMRLYYKSADLAVTARVAADEAEQRANVERYRVFQEGSRLLRETTDTLGRARRLLEDVQSRGAPVEVLAALRSQLDRAEEGIEAAERAMAARQYLAARRQAASARRSARSVVTEVERARAASTT